MADEPLKNTTGCCIPWWLRYAREAHRKATAQNQDLVHARSMTGSSNVFAGVPPQCFVRVTHPPGASAGARKRLMRVVGSERFLQLQLPRKHETRFMRCALSTGLMIIRNITPLVKVHNYDTCILAAAIPPPRSSLFVGVRKRIKEFIDEKAAAAGMK